MGDAIDAAEDQGESTCHVDGVDRDQGARDGLQRRQEGSLLRQQGDCSRGRCLQRQGASSAVRREGRMLRQQA